MDGHSQSFEHGPGYCRVSGAGVDDDVESFELVALEVADLNGYCYGSQDFSLVVWRRLPSLRFSMLERVDKLSTEPGNGVCNG